MKTIEPYSPMARANASAKPGEDRRQQRRRDDADERAQAAGTQRGGGFLDFAFQVFEHGLQRAHHERQADEGQRDDHPERVYKRP